jgi:hypothetical protein
MSRLRTFPLWLVLVLVLTSAWFAWTNWVSPRRLFQKAVLKPIPASVRQIKGIAFSSSGYHKRVLRFVISDPDVRLILGSDQFKEIGFVKYSGKSRILSFGETVHKTTAFILFDGLRNKFPPRWFELNDVKAFRAYLVEEEDAYHYKVRLFLYEQRMGRAYFVGYETRGT